MKYRWLVVVACLLITACDKKTEPVKPAAGTPAETSTESGESTETPEAEKTSEAKGDAAKSPAEQFAAAKAAIENDRAEFMKKYNAAAAEDKVAMRAEYPKAEDYEAAFRDVVSENPGDDAAADALVWIAQNLRDEEATATLLEEYADSESLKDVCSSLAMGMPNQKTEDTLNTLIEKSPHDSVKAAATFALANYLSGLSRFKEAAEENPESDNFDEASRKYLAARGDASETIESLYDVLISDYGNEKTDRGQSYKKIAESALFELRNLSVGKIAPDIEGEDMDGKSFKLSDYRGKVVLLDFWGDW